MDQSADGQCADGHSLYHTLFPTTQNEDESQLFLLWSLFPQTQQFSRL